MKVWTVTSHLVRKNFYDLRYILLFGVTVVLFVSTGLKGATELAEERRRHSALRSKAFQESTLDAAIVIRPFDPLRFVHADIDDELPQYLVVSEDLVDFPVENIELRKLTPSRMALDWTFIITYLLTLLALLVTYDLVSGESERGTLSLVLALGCSRAEYFAGGLLGGAATLIPVAGASYLCSLLAFLTFSETTFEILHWQVLLSVIGGSFLLILVFLALGLLVSILVGRSSTSLLLGLACWLGMVYVIPLSAMLLAKQLASTPSIVQLEADLQQAERKFRRQLYPLSSVEIKRIARQPDLTEEEKRAEIERLQKDIRAQDSLALKNYRKRVIEIREDYLKALRNQARMASRIALLSPIAAYRELASKLVGRGIHGQEMFLQQAKAYSLVFADYASQLRERLSERATVRGITIEEAGFAIRNTLAVSFADVDFDRRDFPRFEPEPSTLEERWLRGGGEVVSLLGWLVTGLALGYMRFERHGAD